jgi:Family of unknown function (DUF5763)
MCNTEKCKATTKKGTRCTRGAITDGYCKLHFSKFEVPDISNYIKVRKIKVDGRDLLEDENNVIYNQQFEIIGKDNVFF